VLDGGVSKDLNREIKHSNTHRAKAAIYPLSKRITRGPTQKAAEKRAMVRYERVK
jgi:hypothetical protein